MCLGINRKDDLLAAEIERSELAADDNLPLLILFDRQARGSPTTTATALTGNGPAASAMLLLLETMHATLDVPQALTRATAVDAEADRGRDGRVLGDGRSCRRAGNAGERGGTLGEHAAAA